MPPDEPSSSSRASVIANLLIPQTAGGRLRTTTWWIMKLWPSQEGTEKQPLVTLAVQAETQEDSSRKKNQVPEGKQQQMPHHQTVVNKAQSKIPLSKPSYLHTKGQLFWNIHHKCPFHWKIVLYETYQEDSCSKKQWGLLLFKRSVHARQ